MTKTKLRVERELLLEKPLSAGRPAYVTAASGIVKKGGRFFVIADDEFFLFSFRESEKFLTSYRLMEGELPADPKERKKMKPDFESLLLLSEKEYPPFGALVAWPSASKKRRMAGVLVPMTDQGELDKPQVFDISSLGIKLKAYVDDLNFEGIFVKDQKLHLLQRGSGKIMVNGIFKIVFTDWLKAIKSGNWDMNIEFEKLSLEKLAGVGLSFTDAVMGPSGAMALATAEGNKNSFSDGKVHGSVLFRLEQGKAVLMTEFEPVTKLEGIVLDGKSIFLVDDADDVSKPSRLYKAEIEH
ncbi:MAG: hypothetical protein SGJ18_02080 [Pseudomonadota bacterium]|nr:hypothetical protein [Pseudomonadota bacterium]